MRVMTSMYMYNCIYVIVDDEISHLRTNIFDKDKKLMFTCNSDTLYKKIYF